MRVEKTSILIVAVVALLALVVPASRMFTLASITQIRPGAEKNVWNGMAGNAVAASKSDKQLARENPKDYLLRSGILISGDDEERDRNADALIRDFPGEPSAYVFAMNAPKCYVNAPNRIEEWGVTPESAAAENKGLSFPVKKLRKDDIRGIERLLVLLDGGSQADPGNGLFKYRRAICLFALHRDDEALETIHQAAVSPRFERYDDTRMAAVDRFETAGGGFNPIGRSNNEHSFDSLMVKDRSVARIVEHIAFMRIKRGDIDGGLSLVMDQISIGHRQAATSSDIMCAIAGCSSCQIAAAALDPLSDMNSIKDPVERDKLSNPGLRRSRELAFFGLHGHEPEAGLFRQWMSDCDAVSEASRRYAQGTGEGSEMDLITSSSSFTQSFRNGVRLLAMCGIALGLWLIPGTLDLWKRLDGFWDRRSAMSAVMVSVLPLGVMVEMLVEARAVPCRAFVDIVLGDSESRISTFLDMFGVAPIFFAATVAHWLLMGLLAVCLVVGLVLAMRKKPASGTRRIVPDAALLLAYAAAFGLVVERAYSAYGSSLDLLGYYDWGYVILPALMLVVYCLVRAINCRFGQMRQSGPLTFLATVRYGSALIAAVFAVTYAVLMPLTIESGHRADRLGRAESAKQAAVIRNALRQGR